MKGWPLLTVGDLRVSVSIYKPSLIHKKKCWHEGRNYEVSPRYKTREKVMVVVRSEDLLSWVERKTREILDIHGLLRWTVSFEGIRLLPSSALC